jgi:hypothetical protein
VTGTKIVGAIAPVSLFSLRSLTFVFLVLLTVPGYFDWDGFFPRKLTNVEVSGRARLLGAGLVNLSFYPIDESRDYIVVYLDNSSDYIIRGATVSAQIKFKSAYSAAMAAKLPPGYTFDHEPITVPNTPCVVPHSEFRVLARTATGRPGQTCIVMLSAEHSKLIPERDDSHYKSVDDDALEFSWWLTSVEGHSQPIKILKDIADWLGIDKLNAQFARVNR